MSELKQTFSGQAILPSEQRKTIGMLGGLAWPSTIYAYQSINEEANKRLGKYETVPMCIWSVEMGQIMPDTFVENWDAVSKPLIDGAKRLERAGADFVYMTCNTLHICANAIEASIAIPFIHAADSVALAAKKAGIKRLALLGTQFTMEKDFYKSRLEDKYGLEVILPEKEDFSLMQRIIFDELVRNDIRPESKREFLRILKEVQDKGAQGAALSCTEIGLLIKQSDMPDLPLLDSDVVHSQRALDISLGAEPELFTCTPSVKKAGNVIPFHQKPV